MLKDAVRKIDRIVRSFEGSVPESEITEVLKQLGIIADCLRRTKSPKRVAFPKTFSIENTDDYISMQEETPSTKIFCRDNTYDTVIKAVISIQSRREDFDRFSLLAEAQKTAPRVTMPAVLVCFHYWLSTDIPLLKKQANNLFRINSDVCDVDGFETKANESWDDLDGNDLIVGEED